MLHRPDYHADYDMHEQSDKLRTVVAVRQRTLLRQALVAVRQRKLRIQAAEESALENPVSSRPLDLDTNPSECALQPTDLALRVTSFAPSECAAGPQAVALQETVQEEAPEVVA